MTARRLVMTCAAAALVWSTSVDADSLPAAAQPSTGGVANILTTLFGRAKPASPTAAARVPVPTPAPINVLPAAMAPDGGAASQAPARAVVARVPPLPRLRPPYAPAAGAKTSVAQDAPAVDRTVTGSIGDAAPAGSPRSRLSRLPADASRSLAPLAPVETVKMAKAVEEPAAAKPPVRHRITTVQRSDGLLGDPSDFLTDEPEAPAPKVPLPDTLEKPKGEAMHSDGTDEAALAAVPLLGTAPFELVRTLQDLQDRMAQGDVQAIAAQRALMIQIDKAFQSADPAVWQDNRNAAAAVTYVLSGGRPEILKVLAGLDPPPAIDRRLLDGVLAYASGKADAATPLLADIDPTGLPASMAGQVAIAQSALAVKSDPAKAMQLLSVARLMAPGTLVEEAAIRRQLLVADRQRSEDTVRSLARQYLDRFRHSVYAGNFRVRFAAALSHMSLDTEERFAELDDMLAMVEPESRCDLYLTVALASAVSGHATAAKLAAERASGLALAGSVQEARAKLYHAAALAAMPELVSKADTEMKGLDRRLLSASDDAFYDVVRSTLDGVLSGTDLSKISVAAAKPLGDGALVEEPAIIKKARAALDETAKLVATAK